MTREQGQRKHPSMEQKPGPGAKESKPGRRRGSSRAEIDRPENVGIAAAIAVCEEAVGHGGAESGSEAEDCPESTLQVAALASWASESDLWVPGLVPDELKDAGTREHFLFHRDEEPDRIFKITKGPGFGVFPAALTNALGIRPVRYWFADRAASPREYLRRLWLSNLEMMSHLGREAYPVLTRLEGFVMREGKLQIVVSQPIFEGVPATETEIAGWFRMHGFEFLRAYTWFRQADGLAVFDTWRDNIMVCKGQIVPFDVIPIHTEGVLLESMKAAAIKVKMR